MATEDLFGRMEVAKPRDDDEEFLQFYSLYPRKDAKIDARKAWRQTVKDRPPIAELENIVRAQCGPGQMLSDRKWMPLPGSYLRGHRWADEPRPLPKQTERKSRISNYDDQMAELNEPTERDITAQSTRIE